MLAGLALLTVLLGCWLVWVIIVSLRSCAREDQARRRGACLLLGDQADQAEWLLRKAGREKDYLLGRLSLAVAVSCESGDTAAIVRILAASMDLDLISQEQWRTWVKDPGQETLRIDVRGKDVRDLRRGWFLRTTA